MTEEPRSAHPQVGPAPPEATASDAPPYPRWLLFGLGALSCAAWLAAAQLDGALAGALPYAPAWLPRALHVALVLAVPTFILCVLRSHRLPARRHARAFYIVEALVMALVALPALLPYYTALNDLSSLLSLPASLGVALAAVDPRVSEWRQARRAHGIEQWWEPKGPSAATALVVGAGFVAVLLVAVFVEIYISPPQYDCRFCGAFGELKPLVFFSFIVVCVPVVMGGAFLGYVLGARIARSDRWQ